MTAAPEFEIVRVGMIHSDATYLLSKCSFDESPTFHETTRYLHELAMPTRLPHPPSEFNSPVAM